MASSEAEYLSRFTTFNTPPAGFDPLTVPQESLAKYGIPCRPHAEKEPRRHALWQRIMARSPKLVKADLSLGHELRKSRRQESPRRESPNQGPYLNLNWAGVSVFRTLPEGYNTVFASWQVPAVTRLPSDVQFPRSATCWVGLDGAYPFTSNDVLQAGTSSGLDEYGNPSYSAFIEWAYSTSPGQIAGYAVTVNNFSVNPGDRLSVLVCSAFKTTKGLIAIYNEVTNQATLVGINAPPGIEFQGLTAECILETGFDLLSGQVLLADFGSVNFYDCLVGSQHYSNDLTGGQTYDISDGNQLTQTELFPSGLTIKWLSNG